MDQESSNTRRHKNPRENASIFSVTTFFFTIPTFIKGWRKDLTQSDIYETLPEHRACVLGDKLEKLWIKEIQRCQKTKKTPSLAIPLIKMFWFENVTFGLILMVLEAIVRPFQCILIGRLISLYSLHLDLNIMKIEIYLYGTGIVVCSFLSSILGHPYQLATYNLGLKLRIACSALIYRKILKLKIDRFEKIGSGKILTLITNDSNRFYHIPPSFHYIWTGLLQTLVITFLLYEEFGISAIFGICFLLIFIPIYLYLGKIMRSLRLKTVMRTDDRVRIMKEVISGIQVIKMYTWEKYFWNLVSLYRRMEIRSVKLSSYIKGIFTTFYLFIQRTSIFITIVAFVLSGHNINAEKAFKLVCFYTAFRNSMIFFLPRGVALLAESVVPLNRLSSFLLSEECESKEEGLNLSKNPVCIQKASVKKESGSDLLSEINFQIEQNSLVAIVGSVGSGKTSLLNIILKELSVVFGKVTTFGSFSYAPQEPWIFPGTVRQNVLFSNKIDRERYNAVLRVCSLSHDLEMLPHHDLTIVGDRGASLSGGQRARISLARAVYNNADIYILDDPLSAVDAHVGKAIFEQCIKQFLHEKTVIMVTHQMQYLQSFDKIFLLDDGIIVAEGRFSELLSQNLDLNKFLHETEEMMIIESEPAIVDVTNITKPSPINAPNEEEENIITGAVSAHVYKTYFTIGTRCPLIFWMFLLFVLTQFFASGADYFIAYWVNLDQARSLNVTEIYTYLSTDVCIYIYSSLILCIITFAVATIISMHNLCMRSSIQLHNSMLNSVINSPLSFFHVNQPGRILNRFSKDMETIDEELPPVMNDTFQLALSMVGVIVVIGIVNYLLLIPAAVTAFVLYYLRKFYLETSRSIKRLDATTRSPVLSHVNTTFQGLSTIRAFRAQKFMMDVFNNYQDLNSTTHFIYISLSRAFGFYVDMVCNVFNFCVIFILLSANDTFGGNIGLTISQCLALLGILQFVIRQYSEMENCMTSVERVIEYSALEKEDDNKDLLLKSVSPTWPENGAITFENISLQYSAKDPPVLKDVSFTINPLEKIGIVGRTGAGKSSVINALFRLSEFSGTIAIDGIDIKQLPLHHLRSKISIIPQQPTVFSGSIRNNLDPFGEYTDAALWEALDNVELRDVISNLHSGLNAEITEGGLNFSVGQRQLICLARAILRNHKILVLDEATANVDPQTDALIQKSVREKFSDCTVLTIAHRLDTVIDSDRIIVMEDGRLVEFDHPHLLLQNLNGTFYDMLQQVERSTRETLKKIAQKNYC